MKILLSDEERAQVQKIEIDALKELDRICRKHGINYSISYGTLLGAIRHKGFIPWDDDIDVCIYRKDYDKFKEICKKELNSKFFYQSHDTDKEYYHLFDKIRVNGTVFKEQFQADHNIHNGIYIDIFPIDYVPFNTIKGKIQFITFYFFRNILMAKYGNLLYRKGKKKLAAIVLRTISFPFSLEFLYNCSNMIASKFNDIDCKYVHNFCSGYRKKDLFEKEILEEYMDIEFEDIKVMAFKNYNDILSKLYGDFMKLPPKEKQVTRHELLEFSIDSYKI